MKEYPEYIKIKYPEETWVGKRLGEKYICEGVICGIYDGGLSERFGEEDFLPIGRIGESKIKFKAATEEEYKMFVRNKIRAFYGDEIDSLQQELLRLESQCQKLLDQI
jgi:hypothetical protein